MRGCDISVADWLGDCVCRALPRWLKVTEARSRRSVERSSADAGCGRTNDINTFEAALADAGCVPDQPVQIITRRCSSEVCDDRWLIRITYEARFHRRVCQFIIGAPRWTLSLHTDGCMRSVKLWPGLQRHRAGLSNYWPGVASTAAHPGRRRSELLHRHAQPRSSTAGVQTISISIRPVVLAPAIVVFNDGALYHCHQGPASPGLRAEGSMSK